jgi:hypothetical protein
LFRKSRIKQKKIFFSSLAMFLAIGCKKRHFKNYNCLLSPMPWLKRQDSLSLALAGDAWIMYKVVPNKKDIFLNEEYILILSASF